MVGQHLDFKWPVYLHTIRIKSHSIIIIIICVETKHSKLSIKHSGCLMAYIMFCLIGIEIWITKGTQIPILFCFVLSAESVSVCVYLYFILMKRWPICGCSFTVHRTIFGQSLYSSHWLSEMENRKGRNSDNTVFIVIHRK